MSRSTPVATMLTPIGASARLLRDWSASSQQQARRNAMLATTALMQRKVERDAVHEYLADAYGTTEAAAPQQARPVATRHAQV